MRLGDLLGVLKGRGHHDAAADIEDLVRELADDMGHRGRNPVAGGLLLHEVDLAHALRHGLESTIEAHRVVEAQRQAASGQRVDELRAEGVPDKLISTRDGVPYVRRPEWDD